MVAALHVGELQFPLVPNWEEPLNSFDKFLVILADQAYFPCLPCKQGVDKE